MAAAGVVATAGIGFVAAGAGIGASASDTSAPLATDPVTGADDGVQDGGLQDRGATAPFGGQAGDGLLPFDADDDAFRPQGPRGDRPPDSGTSDEPASGGLVQPPTGATGPGHVSSGGS